MFIYTLLLIPIIVTIVLYFKFKHEVVWWEYLLNFGVTFLCIFISKALIQYTMVSDTEYWGGWVTEVRYYEAWDEYIHRTCTCCCDKDGNNCSTYDCSYVDEHAPYWMLYGSNNEKVKINEAKYNELKNQFKTNPIFIDMHRGYHSYDGDMYKVKWNESDNSLEPVISKHRYENKARVSSSSFAIQEPPKEIFEEYDLYHYPKIYNGYEQQIIHGYDDPKAERAFQLLNAKLGKNKQFKSFILVFKNKTREAGLYQEEQWQGGNKNELNITIGIDDDSNVLWCHVFSWTEEPIIVVNTRTFIENQKELDLVKLAKFLNKEVPQNWVRKEFADFDYLTIEPKGIHIFIAFLVTLIVNLGVAIYVIKNDFTEDNY